MNHKPERHIVVLLYYSLKDPLCSGLILDHLIALHPSSSRFHLITFEQERFYMEEDERIRKEKYLRSQGICWYPMKYSSGSFFILKKSVSFIRTFLLIRRLKKQYASKEILAMATLAGTFAYLSSRMLGMKMIQHTYEPHAEILEGAGLLRKNSLRFKIAHYFERKIGQRAEIVLCTTRHMVDRLAKSGRTSGVYRMPTSVNSERTNFSQVKRDEWRTRWGWNEEYILLYPGKFGGMYRERETIELMAAFVALDNAHRAVIVTDFDREKLKKWAVECGMKDHQWLSIDTIPLDEIPGLISAADLGLIAYKEFPARAYCSPVKAGEFLLCGVPFVVQKETGEDDDIALAKNVGIVLQEWSFGAWKAQLAKLNEFKSLDKSQLRRNCREAGLDFRGHQHAVKLMRELLTD